MQSKVYVKLPRAGLANKLLVWAHAYVFAFKYQLELFESSWFHLSIGPLIRMEKSKRFYFKLIKKERSPSRKDKNLDSIFVPYSDWSNMHLSSQKMYVFNEVPHHESYFELIKPCRNELIAAFNNKIQTRIHKKVNKIKIPKAAIHIRMGDFKSMPWTEYDWSWYAKLISDIRKLIGREVAFTIFTDGSKQEIELFKMVENLEYFHSGNDLVDLLVMSKSKVLITYPGSTFSYWAGFIGDSILLHKNDVHRGIGDNQFFEGFPYKNGKLKTELIKSIERSF